MQRQRVPIRLLTRVFHRFHIAHHWTHALTFHPAEHATRGSTPAALYNIISAVHRAKKLQFVNHPPPLGRCSRSKPRL